MTPFHSPSLRPGFRAASLFAPRRVAFLGDPALPETAILARNLVAGQFKGVLHTIGFHWDGLDEAPSLDALEEAPDLAVISLPPEAQPAAFAALAARGCHAAVVPVASPDLAALARGSGVRALGQRSFGLAVPPLGLNATLSHLVPRPGKLALLCQSSALARAILDYAEAQGFGFSLIAGIGGNADYGFAGALDWLARDAATNAVLLDLRRIKNRRQFISAARATARTRPVVAIRPGSASREALGGADAVMEAALRRAGVLRVADLAELLAAAETLSRVRVSSLRSGAEADRIAVVSNGLATGQMATDSALRRGGRLAEIPEAAWPMLHLSLPPRWHGGNPLVLPHGEGHRLAEVAAMIATLPEVGSVVAIHSPNPEEDSDAVAAAMAGLSGIRGAPILVGWLGQATGSPQRSFLARSGIAVFPTPERAVRGALHLAQDRRNRDAAAELPPRDVLDFAPDRAAVRRLLDTVRDRGRVALNEAEALSVFDAYGVPTIARRVVAGPAEAGKAAMELGFPVVLKLLSAELPRKTEIGGVAVGLRDVKSVRAAGLAMLTRAAQERPDCRIDGLLVERQAQPGAELRLRLGDEVMFGPWIGFGAGGTTADLQADEAVDLPPLNRVLATALIGRTRISRRLHGWRDQEAVKVEAVSDALVRLSALVVDFPEIKEATINPLIASATGVIAVDADLRLRAEGEAAMLAIPPYPAELAEAWTAPDGRRLVVRPIRPEDAAAHAEAFRNMDPDDIRWRFFGSMRELPRAQIARMTQIDYDREMAFVAIETGEDGVDRIVGVSRLTREGQGNGAEFAVVVLPRWKGKGLGRHLMRRVLDWGQETGIRRVVGQVLADNTPMQAFVAKLGFHLHRLEDDVLEASLDL